MESILPNCLDILFHIDSIVYLQEYYPMANFQQQIPPLRLEQNLGSEENMRM